MTRTLKATKVTVTYFDENGAPVVVEHTFNLTSKKAIIKECVKQGVLPNLTTAKRINIVTSMTDDKWLMYCSVDATEIVAEPLED